MLPRHDCMQRQWNREFIDKYKRAVRRVARRNSGLKATPGVRNGMT